MAPFRFPAETMAHVAAENIASQIRGEEPIKEENFGDIPPVCIMDAGNNGVVILADKTLPPRKPRGSTRRTSARLSEPGPVEREEDGFEEGDLHLVAHEEPKC